MRRPRPIRWLLLTMGRCPNCWVKLVEKEYGGTTSIATVICWVYKCPKCGRRANDY